jgi:hypothetical protein
MFILNINVTTALPRREGLVAPSKTEGYAGGSVNFWQGQIRQRYQIGQRIGARRILYIFLSSVLDV